MSTNYHVYLISDAVYIAAESEQAAREISKREGCEDGDECRIADHHKYWEDGYNRENGQQADSSMIEAATKKISEGETMPFVVGYSLDCL